MARIPGPPGQSFGFVIDGQGGGPRTRGLLPGRYSGGSAVPRTSRDRRSQANAASVTQAALLDHALAALGRGIAPETARPSRPGPPACLVLVEGHLLG